MFKKLKPDNILKGLHFKGEAEGVIVIDGRDAMKPRYLGGIIRKPFSPYYMLCPFTRRNLYFDLKPPSNFRSTARAQRWLEKHAIAYNDNRIYTPCNMIVRYIVADSLAKLPVTSVYFQVSLTQALLSILLAHSQPIGPLPSIALSAFFGISSVINVIMWVREKM